jgi:phosphoserine phosphatase RsbX
MATSVISGSIRSEQADFQLNWSIAAQSKNGAPASGDGHLIYRNQDRIIFAVADGTGSGPAASQAARTCLEQMQTTQPNDLAQAFAACHASLLRSRGAALGLCAVDMARERLTWASVGDVSGTILRASDSGKTREIQMCQFTGTLGVAFQKVRATTEVLERGDFIMIATDGVSNTFRDAIPRFSTAQNAAQHVLTHFGQTADDRLILAIQVVKSDAN